MDVHVAENAEPKGSVMAKRAMEKATGLKSVSVNKPRVSGIPFEPGNSVHSLTHS